MPVSLYANVKYAVTTFLTHPWGVGSERCAAVHAAAIDILSIKKVAKVFLDEPPGQENAANVAKVVCPARLADHANVEKARSEDIQAALIVEVENVSAIHLLGPVARVKYVHGFVAGQPPRNDMEIYRTHVIRDVAPRHEIGL